MEQAFELSSFSRSCLSHNQISHCHPRVTSPPQPYSARPGSTREQTKVKVILLEQKNKNLAGAPVREVQGQGLVSQWEEKKEESLPLPQLCPQAPSPEEVGPGTHLTFLSGGETRRTILQANSRGRGGRGGEQGHWTPTPEPTRVVLTRDSPEGASGTITVFPHPPFERVRYPMEGANWGATIRALHSGRNEGSASRVVTHQQSRVWPLSNYQSLGAYVPS